MLMEYKEFIREVTLLKREVEYEEALIVYSVKHKYFNSNKLKQYEICFHIRKVETRILLLIKLRLPITETLSSPFNSKAKTDLHISLIEASSCLIYKDNFRPLLNFVIKANKRKIFDYIVNFTYCEGVLGYTIEGKEQGSKIENVGEIIHFDWLDYKTKLTFEVIELIKYENEEKDCVYHIDLIDSQPIQVKFKYLTIVKSINKNISLISVEHTFESRLSPDQMDKHIITITSIIKTLKRLCES